MFAFGEPAVFEMAVQGAEDAHGNPIVTFADAVTVEGCGFAPGGSQELYGPGRNPVTSVPQLYCPPGTVVTSRSRVTVRGKLYQVDGDPAEWRSPFTGWEPGVVVTLERTDG
jgi:uncharacterized Zn-binding protein involved in type VI secretion